MNDGELLKIANEGLRKRLAGMASELAHVQSLLGDTLVRNEELESAIKQHYVATFGHSACFERDEKLWAVLQDGNIRKWIRVSVPPEEEHEMGCAQYRATLFAGAEKSDEPS